MWGTVMSFIRLAAAVLLLTVGTSLVNPPMAQARTGTDCFEAENYACLTGEEPHEGYLCDEPEAPDCYNCKKQAGVCNAGGLGSMEGYRTFDN